MTAPEDGNVPMKVWIDILEEMLANPLCSSFLSQVQGLQSHGRRCAAQERQTP